MKNLIVKLALAVQCVLCLMAMMLVSASAAYIDPSSVSILVTSISAVVIGLGAVFFVWWRKVKRKVSKTLGIDENANKEVEEDVEFDDED